MEGLPNSFSVSQTAENKGFSVRSLVAFTSHFESEGRNRAEKYDKLASSPVCRYSLILLNPRQKLKLERSFGLDSVLRTVPLRILKIHMSSSIQVHVHFVLISGPPRSSLSVQFQLVVALCVLQCSTSGSMDLWIVRGGGIGWRVSADLDHGLAVPFLGSDELASEPFCSIHFKKQRDEDLEEK